MTSLGPAASAPSLHRPGSRILAERFELLEELGSGGTGTVHLARDRLDKGLYAIKSVPLGDGSRCAALRREFALRARLVHPQVAGVHELGRDEISKTAFLIGDYVAGQDLVGAMRRLGPRWTLPFLAQALNAADFLHSRGVVHGDFKPANLRVAGEAKGPVIKLLDFDLARAIGDEQTALGGTPEFMAPALFQGASPSPSTDLYAIGKTFARAQEEAFGGSAPKARAHARVQRVLERLSCDDEHLAFPSAHAALSELLSERSQAAQLPRAVEPVLCGREEELLLLKARLDDLCSGQLSRRLVLIQGPEGFGKSRMLREMARLAYLADVDVVRIGCHAPMRALEIPWILGRYCLREQMELASSLDDLVNSERPSCSPQRTLRELCRELVALSQRRPLLVLLDDMDSADEPSLDFLRMLERTRSTQGPLVCATATSDPGRGASALDRLRRQERWQTLWLEPLSRGETTRLVASLRSWSSREQPDVEGFCRGNPRLATLLGRSRDPIGEPGAAAPGDYPGELLQHRIDELEPSDAERLRDLAVLLRPANALVVGALWNSELEDVHASLSTLRDRGLVEEEFVAGEQRFSVGSKPLCRALLRAEGPQELAARHERALRAWERCSRGTEVPSEMLVQHAICAGRCSKALAFGIPSIDKLLARGSLHLAERLASALLDMPGAIPPASRATLGLQLAEAQVRSGKARQARPRIQEELRCLSSTSCEEAEGSGQNSLAVRLHSLLAETHEAEGNYDPALSALENALSQCNDSMPASLRMRVFEHLGRLCYRMGSFDQAEGYWQRGLALVPDGRSPSALADIWNNLGCLDTARGRWFAAVSRHEQALAIRRGLGDLDGESRSLVNLANISLQQGALDRAAELYERGLRIIDQVGTAQVQALTWANCAALERLLGRFASAFDLLRRSIRMRRRLGDRPGEAVSRRQLAELLIDKGRYGDAAAELDKAARLASRGTEPQQGRQASAQAVLAMRTGDIAAAEEQLERLAEELGAQGSLQDRAELARLRAEARLLRSAPDEALAELDQARETLEGCEDPIGLGRAYQLKARAALDRGDREQAARSLQIAEGIARSHRVPKLLAETLLVSAELELQRGDLDRAAGLQSQAEAAVTGIGLPSIEFSLWRYKALHAQACGQSARALFCLRRCVEQLRRDLDHIRPQALQELFLKLPHHRQVVEALRGMIECMPTVPSPKTQP
jgi:tetratricopeptide (TPR) repeat protein